MRMMLARISLVVSGLLFGAFGAWFLLDPAGAAALVEIELKSATARTDFRAGYGGLNLALGLLLALSARQAGTVRAGLWLQLTVGLGYAAGRTLGIVLEGGTTSVMYTILAVEVAGAAVAALLLRTLKGYGQ